MAIDDLTDLISHWPLNEVSGTRVDSHGSNDLDDVNTVTQAAGKIGNAAEFVNDNDERLRHDDNADLSGADVDWTFAIWLYFDSKTARWPAIGIPDALACRQADLKQCVDKRGDGRALGDNDQHPEQNHDNDDRREPEFLALPHEIPQVLEKI